MLSLLSFGLVGYQLPSYNSSVFFSLQLRLVRFPQTLHLLWGKVCRGDVSAVQRTLPATAQRRGSSYTPLPSDPGRWLMTASTGLTLHLVWIQRQQWTRRAGRTRLVEGGLKAEVCLTQWPPFKHQERRGSERTASLTGRGQKVESEGSRVLSGPLHTAQQLCKAGSIVQTPSLQHRAPSH